MVREFASRMATAAVVAAAVAVTTVGISPAVADGPEPVQLFASPAVADGAGNCSSGSPCSLSDAIDAERAARASMGDTMSSYIVVYLHGGMYRLTEPIELGAADSGSAEDKRVVFRNYPNESPVISGGVPVTGWTQVAGEPGVWTASTAGIEDFLQLYAEGHPLERAHTDPVEGQRWTVPGTRKMQIRVPDDVALNVADVAGVHVRIMHTWRSLRYPVASIGAPVTENGEDYRYIQLAGDIASWSSEPRDDRGPNPVETGNEPKAYQTSGETVLSGAREFMNKNGEWYLDPNADQVYLKADFDPNTVEVSAPAQEQLLSVDGARHVTIYGLQFAHSAWNTPLTVGNFQRQGGVRMWDADKPAGARDNGVIVGAGNGAINALWWVNPAAVRVAHSSDIRFNRNAFRDTGANGVNLDKGTKDIQFKANIFTNIADTGLFVGTHQWPWLPEDEQNIDTTVVDNVFRDMGMTYATDSAITMTYPNGAEIRNNLIENVHNIAINIGYVQGMLDVRKDLADVQITRNRIDHVCITARDCGAWHAVGLSRFDGPEVRSRVARNYITDIHPNTHTNAGSRVYALYADGASGGWELKNNVWDDVQSYGGQEVSGLRINAQTQKHGVTLAWGMKKILDVDGTPIKDQNGQEIEIYTRTSVAPAILYANVRVQAGPLRDQIEQEAGLSSGYGFLETLDLATASIGGNRGPYPEVP